MVRAAETRLRALSKHWNWFAHKYMEAKRVACNTCRQPIPNCPKCGNPLIQITSEKIPDFVIAWGFTYVECKNSDSTGRWKWREIYDGDRVHQREWLLKEGGWLFIELGLQPAPNGKSAYLIQMLSWVREVEPILLEKDMKSIIKTSTKSRPGGDELMPNYRLEWENGKWQIPKGHPWWVTLKGHLYYINKYVEDNQ